MHSAGIAQQAADMLSPLPTTNGFAECIEDDIPTQCVDHFDNAPCLVDPDADAYFEPEVNDLFSGLSGHLGECSLNFHRRVCLNKEA